MGEKNRERFPELPPILAPPQDAHPFESSDMSKIKKYNTGNILVPFMALEDPNLSLQAKGLFAYICSKPDDWVFCIDERKLKDDISTIIDARKELIKHGYLL